MKNIIAVALMLGLLPTAPVQQAQAGESALFEKITHKVAVAAQKQKTKPTNAGAIKQNYRVDFNFSEKFRFSSTDIERGPFEADMACKAYALDSHWLILAGTCMNYFNGDIFELGDHEYIERYGRKINRTHVGSFELNPGNYAKNKGVMLIWDQNANFAGPYVNVLATNTPKQLFVLNANHTIKIHTARFGLDAVRERSLKPHSVQDNTFQLREGRSDLSGTATDPLFLVSARGNEFLAAYNAGTISYALQMSLDDITHTFDGKPSPNWYTLSANDLQFIKKTVQQHRPKDWARIKGRLFFNQTSVPFFK